MGKNTPFVRSAYNYDQWLASEVSGVSCGEPSLAQQQFAEEVDINTLIRRFHLSGEMPDDVRPVTYGDFTEVFDFHTAANAIALAHENFEAMPAELRQKFQNDPARFVAFCSDDKNLPEMRSMGLATAERTPLPTDNGPSGPSGAPEARPAPADPAPSAPAGSSASTAV